MPLVSTAWLRRAAVERIRFFEEALERFGLKARFGAELEFFPLNKSGVPQKNLLNESKLTEHLRETVPGIERVHREIGRGAQYELVTGPNPKMPHVGLEHVSPLRTAETVAAFQEGIGQNAERWGMGGASYTARQRVNGYMENSGLHTNISLWDSNGANNLFHAHHTTSGIERHVIDSLIDTHASGTLAYLPNANSYERVRSTATYNGSNTRDISSGVPNIAGHMPNKGMNLNYLFKMVDEMKATNRVPIASVTSRFRSPQNMAFGTLEKVIYKGKRSNMIGWETPAQHRLESRLAGADADPYLTTAAELASVYDAVTRHMHVGEGIHATRLPVRTGNGVWKVDVHNGVFKQRSLPANVEEAREALRQSDRMRALLGEDLYHGIIAQGLDRTQAGANIYAESLAHVAAQNQNVEPYATDVTRKISDSLAALKTPLRFQKSSWVDYILGRGSERVR